MDWTARSLRSVWHPCTQMKDHEANLPMIPIRRGEGVWLEDFEGNRYLDSISSWWVNLFGHANPRLNAALIQQVGQLEHVIFAGFTHEPAIELAEALTAVALKHNLYIMSDEIYEHLTYDGAKHYSPASFSPEAFARTIIVSGFAKTYAMTGWRLGTTVAPAPIAKAIAELQSQMTSNATTFAQYGAVAALKEKDKTDAALKTMLVAFDRRRKFLHAELNKIPGIKCLLAEGAFYLFPNISSFGLSSADFCARLLETEKVAAVPGSAFGAEGYLRLSYATSDEIIAKGVSRLAKFCATLKPVA